MKIEFEISPDENIMHFYPQGGLKIKQNCECFDFKTLRQSPLAEKIFDFGNIKSVVLTSDCISVVKDETGNWQILKPQIMAEIMDFAASGAAPVIEKNERTQEEILANINALLEARIRPAIKKDGGDIDLRLFEDGVVYVELKGKCVGCPYANRTLKDGIEKLLKTYIPEIKSVEKYEG